MSYYYPPVGGIGLPGCMRVMKFIKYLEDWDISVLTVRPDKYPEFFLMDNHVSLPIRQEKVYHTSVTDIFMNMLFLRNKLFLRKRPIGRGDNNVGKYKKKDVSVGKRNNSSFYGIIGRIKDIVHDLCYFPDHASPWIPNAIFSGFKIIKREKPDIIFATGMPWSVLVITNILYRFTGVPYICDFRDPWVDNPFHQSKGYLFDKANKYLEKTVVKKAALVTANTSRLMNQMARRYPDFPKEKIVELPNGYDPDDFKFVDTIVENTMPSISLKLVHAGFLYGERDPSPILNAIMINYDRYKYSEGEIKFIQVGSLEGNIKEEMDKYINLGYAKCVGQVPYRDCIEILRNADVLVIIQQGTETQIPSKVYEYIYLNKPIITITKKGGALWDLLEKYQFGELIEPTDIEKISHIIHEYYVKKKIIGYLNEEYPGKRDFDIRNVSNKLSEYMMGICVQTP